MPRRRGRPDFPSPRGRAGGAITAVRRGKVLVLPARPAKGPVPAGEGSGVGGPSPGVRRKPFPTLYDSRAKLGCPFGPPPPSANRALTCDPEGHVTRGAPGPAAEGGDTGSGCRGPSEWKRGQSCTSGSAWNRFLGSGSKDDGYSINGCANTTTFSASASAPCGEWVRPSFEGSVRRRPDRRRRRGGGGGPRRPRGSSGRGRRRP